MVQPASLCMRAVNECWQAGPLATCSTCTVGDCPSHRTQGANSGLEAQPEGSQAGQVSGPKEFLSQSIQNTSDVFFLSEKEQGW